MNADRAWEIVARGMIPFIDAGLWLRDKFERSTRVFDPPEPKVREAPMHCNECDEETIHEFVHWGDGDEIAGCLECGEATDIGYDD